ncbi:helix-turn-helix domain-containing protein [Halalkalibacter okhensis]|nr:helix-turn-helix transcriptional regulator [Halalkalibacter okhensis]
MKMIKFKLKEQLEIKGKTMYWLSKQTGVRPNTLSQWVNNEDVDNSNKKVKSISLETLDSICEILDCEIGDIIEHVKKKDH